MKQKLLNKLWLRVGMIVAIMTTALSGTVKADYEELYSADFTSVATHSYTQNKTFSLSNKSWTASVSQVNGGVFYLGCNSNNASKGVLNNNSTFSAVVTALKSADATYNSNYTTAHAYALLFDNTYSDVTKVTFNWAGGNNAFQVYLFGDSGSGYVLLGSTNYATSGASTAGSVEWTGSATDYTKFAIVARPGATSSTATNKTLRAASFTIYETSGSTQTCATPTISPNGGDFVTSQEVTLTCTTPNASIYYTLDGSDPSSSSTLYTEPFTITESKTVKAIAVLDNYEDSQITTAEFTKVTPLANIAALTAETETGNYYVTLNNAVVTYVNGNYAYIQDASGAVVLYKSSHGLTAGDVLNGTATVAYQLRNANPQITTLSGVTPVSGTAPNPTSVAASAWSYTFSNVLSQYFQITGATITQSNSKYYVSLNNESIQLYKASGSISSLDLTKTYTITGFPTLYNTTKELQIFADPEVEVSSDPTITVSTASLSDFTYEAGNGPSTTKTFTVEGANLTENISLSLSGNDYEMSLTDNGTYTSSLTLNQTSGAVASTTVYVRLKAGLSANSYNDNITISSTGATNVTVSLSGNVTTPAGPNVTWDLTTNDYDSSAEDLVSWTSSQATMTLAKGESSTKANNYLGGDNNYTHTRFYQNQVLTIAPASGYQIVSAEITAVTSYVTGFTGNAWTNATTSTSGTTVTVTPSNGTQAMSVTISAACRATAVKVYYAVNSTPTLSVDPTTAEPFTYEVGDGPSDYQMFEVTGINLTDDITVSVTGEYELSDGNPYTSSLTLSSGDIFMVHLKEGLEIGSYDGEITISSTDATNLTIALSGTVTAVIPATIIPDITTVNVGSAEGDGTIDLTYTKVDESTAEVRFFDADGNSVEDSYYSWIAAEIDTNNNIYFTVGANNTSAARTAYLKVYGQDDNGGDVFSELITITQSKYQPTGTLSNANIVAAGTGAGGYSDWTITDGKGKKWFSRAIKNQHSNATSGYHFLQIKKNDNSGPYYIQVPDYGRKITSLKMTVSSTGQPMTGGSNAATIYFSASNTTSETGTGVASGSGASSVTIDCSSLNLNTGYITASGAVRIWDVDVTYEPLKLNSYGYATYASTNALDFTNADGFTAWQITGVSGDAINFSQITGAVEAGTGVLLMGTGGAEVTIINAESGETLTGNKLEGVTESKSINANEYYGLSGQSFVKVNAGIVSAGKALLPASEVPATVKAFTFVFEDDATAIKDLNDLKDSKDLNDVIYNLAGQRMNKMQKGINIVNGKKIMY